MFGYIGLNLIFALMNKVCSSVHSGENGKYGGWGDKYKSGS